MKIEEAIEHCEEKAREMRISADLCNLGTEMQSECIKCAEEHEQLAEWLTELKEIREVVNEFTSTHTRPYDNRMEMSIAFCEIVLIVEAENEL